jgi:hypothetical protein
MKAILASLAVGAALTVSTAHAQTTPHIYPACDLYASADEQRDCHSDQQEAFRTNIRETAFTNRYETRPIGWQCRGASGSVWYWNVTAFQRWIDDGGSMPGC